MWRSACSRWRRQSTADHCPSTAGRSRRSAGTAAVSSSHRRAVVAMIPEIRSTDAAIFVVPSTRVTAPRRPRHSMWHPGAMRGRAEYACAVNVVEAALVGGLVGGLLVSVLGALVAWRERHRDAAEARDQRAHDLQMRVLEHEHHLQRAALEDAARLRDLRVARLTEEARELARALFDLEQLAL